MTRQEEGKRGEGGERRGGTERWGRREPERGKTWAGLPAAWGAGREPAGAAPAGVLCATIGRPPGSFPGAPRAGAGLGRKDSPAAVPRGGGGELRGPRPGTATTVRGDTGEAGGVRPVYYPGSGHAGAAGAAPRATCRRNELPHPHALHGSKVNNIKNHDTMRARGRKDSISP